MTYYPGGDPGGGADGYPGSIFGVGHNWNQHVSEVTIPKPVVSAAKNLRDLNTAKTLQPFANIRGDLFGEMEQARCGLAYLPRQGAQRKDKLYFCWAPHLDEGSRGPSHGWCELSLANPAPAGPWSVGGLTNYMTADYIFAMPKAWADKNTPGMLLATGRFRDGGQGGLGPTLYAYGPWNEGNPPARGAKVKAVTLLQYSTVYVEDQHEVKDYHHADEWRSGAWLTAGSRSAVVFIGTKGKGKCWYGFANGVVWPDEGPFPPVPPAPNDSRGWWSSSFSAQMLFYDPADLAAVAKGGKKSWEPQPYAVMEMDKVLFSIKSKQQKSHVTAACFDRARGLLYVMEFRGDGDKSLVHVWGIAP